MAGDTTPARFGASFLLRRISATSLPMKKKTLVVMYGGTQLTPPQQSLVKAIAEEIVLVGLAGEDAPQYVLVTGGFRIFENLPDSVSTDWAAASAAEATLRQRNVAVEPRLETWLPDPALDRLKEKVHRFEAGAVKRTLTTSDRIRRFRIVHDADVLLTISGEGNTETVLDLAYVIQKPALPLPFTGKDSQAFWEKHREYIRERFRLDPAAADALEHFDLEAASEAERRDLARHIVHDILPMALRRSCLVLMPFQSALTPLYEEVIRPAIIDAGFDAIRIDFSVEPGDIFEQFVRLLEKADAVVVDVTGANPNVMYELGHAHARRIEPLLIHHGTIGDKKSEPLPFYLLQQKVEHIPIDQPGKRERLGQRVGEYLASVRLNKR